MSHGRATPVPSTGTTTSSKNSTLPDPVRDRCENDQWSYPEDVPSGAMRQHPRRSMVGRITLGLSIAAVIALWAGVALAETDTQGRYILHGDVTARPAPHHSGGGNTASAARYFLRIADQGPFRVTGDWFSSGVLVVALVAGPDAMNGSCIDPGATFRIHEARGGGNSDAAHDAGYSGAFLPPLRAHYHQARHSGQITVLRAETLTAADLGGMGYPVCED